MVQFFSSQYKQQIVWYLTKESKFHFFNEYTSFNKLINNYSFFKRKAIQLV